MLRRRGGSGTVFAIILVALCAGGWFFQVSKLMAQRDTLYTLWLAGLELDRGAALLQAYLETGDQQHLRAAEPQVFDELRHEVVRGLSAYFGSDLGADQFYGDIAQLVVEVQRGLQQELEPSSAATEAISITVEQIHYVRRSLHWFDGISRRTLSDKVKDPDYVREVFSKANHRLGEAKALLSN